MPTILREKDYGIGFYSSEPNEPPHLHVHKLGMQPNNTTPPDVVAVHMTEDRLTFDLEDGRSVSVPLAFYPTLMLATPEERADYQICHSSVYWPKLDCDLSSECLLRGAKEARKYAEQAWRKKKQSGQAKR